MWKEIPNRLPGHALSQCTFEGAFPPVGGYVTVLDEQITKHPGEDFALGGVVGLVEHDSYVC